MGYRSWGHPPCSRLQLTGSICWPWVGFCAEGVPGRFTGDCSKRRKMYLHTKSKWWQERMKDLSYTNVHPARWYTGWYAGYPLKCVHVLLCISFLAALTACSLRPWVLIGNQCMWAQLSWIHLMLLGRHTPVGPSRRSRPHVLAKYLQSKQQNMFHSLHQVPWSRPLKGKWQSQSSPTQDPAKVELPS